MLKINHRRIFVLQLRISLDFTIYIANFLRNDLLVTNVPECLGIIQMNHTQSARNNLSFICLQFYKSNLNKMLHRMFNLLEI